MNEERKLSLNPEHVALLWCSKVECSGNAWDRQCLCMTGDTEARPQSWLRKMLVQLRSQFLSMLPAFFAVAIFGGMVVMFLLVLADVACIDAKNLAEVMQ